VTNPIVVSGFAGLGGYIGEKILGDGTNEALLLGDGVNTNQILGSAPVVTTSAVTNNNVVGASNTATLNGNLQSLNGMPTADVWFEWGYSPLFINNTTPNVTATIAGAQSVVLTGFISGLTVYYRIASTTEGATRGSLTTFTAGGSAGTSYKFLRDILLLVVACGILAYVLNKTGNIVYALAGVLAGIVGFKVIEAFVNYLFR
jgi:hypothetical protein